MMTEDQVVKIIKDHVESLFPKNCKVCGYHFETLKEYLQYVDHVGVPHSYDAEASNWKPQKSYGTHSFSNCKCGNTLSLDSSKMKLKTMWKLLWWAKNERAKRNISVSEILNDIRNKIDQQVLMS